MHIKTFVAAFQNWVGNIKTNRLPVLVIDDWVPDPSIGAGAPRAAQLLRALIETGAEVTHFSTSTSPGGNSSFIRSIPSVTFQTQQSRRTYELSEFLRRFRDRFAVILISRPHNMSTFKIAWSQLPATSERPLVIYDAEAIFSQREILQKALEAKPLSASERQAMVDSEIDLARAVDIVLTVNEQNATLYRAAGHADVRVLRHAVSGLFGRTPQAARANILFVGPTYADGTPNTDSVVWFVDKVLPIIRRDRQKSFRLTVVGRSAAPGIAALPRNCIDLRGPLQELDEEYARALVFVAPTRFAAGIPLKVYDAAAHGVPCVITSLLAEQLGWRDEEEVLVADTPEHFAQRCLRLMEDEALWGRLRIAAYERTLRECDWSLFNSTVRELLPPTSMPRSSLRRPQPGSDA